MFTPFGGCEIAENVDGFVGFVVEVVDVRGECMLRVESNAQDFVDVCCWDLGVIDLYRELIFVVFWVR